MVWVGMVGGGQFPDPLQALSSFCSKLVSSSLHMEFMNVLTAFSSPDFIIADSSSSALLRVKESRVLSSPSELLNFAFHLEPCNLSSLMA